MIGDVGVVDPRVVDDAGDRIVVHGRSTFLEAAGWRFCTVRQLADGIVVR